MEPTILGTPTLLIVEEVIDQHCLVHQNGHPVLTIVLRSSQAGGSLPSAP
jgi:hypothetical protein